MLMLEKQLTFYLRCIFCLSIVKIKLEVSSLASMWKLQNLMKNISTSALLGQYTSDVLRTSQKLKYCWTK